MPERDVAGKKVRYGKAHARAESGATGIVYKPTWEQEQSVMLFRKILLRKHLLRWMRRAEGAAYVPFMGDGEIAEKLYAQKAIFGADLDAARVQNAQSKFPGADIRVADCDSWPFPDISAKFALADFDAFSEPYTSFRSFWTCAQKAERVMVVFTDGHRQGLNRTGWFDHPSGEKIRLGTPDGPRMGVRELKMPVFNAYLTKYIWPWFEDYVAPYRILDRWRYQRDMMIYWGAVIEEPL